MARRWFLIGGAAVVILAAAGLYAGLVAYPQARLETALSETQQFLPPGTSLSYKNAHYSPLSGQAVLTGVVLKSAGPLGLEVTIDKLTLDRPSLSLANGWQRAEANPAALAPNTTLPVAAGISCTGIVIRAREAWENIGSMDVEGLRIHPWALLHPGMPSWAETQALLTKRPPPTSSAAFVPLLRFEAAWALGVAYTALHAKDITGTAQIPATPKLPVRAIAFSAARSDSSDNDRGVLDEATVEHMKFAFGPPAGTVTVEKAVVTGLDMRKPLSQMIEATALRSVLLDGLTLGWMEATGMTVKPPAGSVVSLGAFALSKIVFADGLPVAGALKWDGLQLTRAEMPSPRARLAFDQLGIGSMTISLAAAYDWDLKTGSFSLHDFLLKVAELGSLNLSTSLTDLAPSLREFDRVSLAHATLRYTDASLVKRAFDATAEAGHVDPAALREQVVAILQSGAGDTSDKPALAEAVNAIITFLGAPHTLAVTLSPPAPVPLVSLEKAADMPPADLASQLGLVVTANQ